MSMKKTNSTELIQYIVSNSTRCTLQQLHAAQQLLKQEKNLVAQNITRLQSHVNEIKAKYGDTSTKKSSSKKNASKQSRKRKRKRQNNDDDEDFDPMQLTTDAMVDEDFEFSPPGGTGLAGEPDTPLSAVVTPTSATVPPTELTSKEQSSTLTGRGSKKNSRKKRAKSATTKKNSKKKRRKGKYTKHDDDDDMLDVDFTKDESDDEVGYGLQGKDISQPHHQFWRMIDEYFQPVHNDPEKLNLLQPVDIEHDQDIHEIPELGQHYLQKWSEEKMQDGADNAARANSQNLQDSVPSVDLDVASDFFDCNSITVRLLQSMIEEQDVLNVGRKSKKGRPKLTRNTRQQMENQNQYREALLQSGEIQRGISASTDDYTSVTMSQIDDRITQELQSLGLFSLPNENGASDSVTDEDDEVLAEIKNLQQELKEQISISNNFRKKIYDSVMERKEEEEALLRRRREDKRIIREFERRVFNPRVRV